MGRGLHKRLLLGAGRARGAVVGATRFQAASAEHARVSLARARARQTCTCMTLRVHGMIWSDLGVPRCRACGVAVCGTPVGRPTRVSDRVCAKYSTCELGKSFEVVKPTKYTDRACKKVTVCDIKKQVSVGFGSQPSCGVAVRTFVVRGALGPCAPLRGQGESALALWGAGVRGNQAGAAQTWAGGHCGAHMCTHTCMRVDDDRGRCPAQFVIGTKATLTSDNKCTKAWGQTKESAGKSCLDIHTQSKGQAKSGILWITSKGSARQVRGHPHVQFGGARQCLTPSCFSPARMPACECDCAAVVDLNAAPTRCSVALAPYHARTFTIADTL